MLRLAADQYRKLVPRYLTELAFFPLIAAVLEHSQDGAVWVNDALRPRQAYVEHCFGFAQIFGEPAPAFETDLEAYFSARRDFSVEKVRLYTPALPALLLSPGYFGYRSERQKFTLAQERLCGTLLTDVAQPSPIRMQDGDEIEARFGIVTRFRVMPTSLSLRHRRMSFGRPERRGGLLRGGQPAGEGATAATGNDPAFRQQGLGRRLLPASWRPAVRSDWSPSGIVSPTISLP